MKTRRQGRWVRIDGDKWNRLRDTPGAVRTRVVRLYEAWRPAKRTKGKTR
jgi:hypothetical protein